MLSRFQALGNRCRKVLEIENWRVCRILKRKGKEFSPNKKTFTTSLKGKLILLFQDNAQLRQDYLMCSLNWTEWRMQNADVALYELACSSKPRG